MSVIITMANSLAADEIDGEFIEVLEGLNLASAAGKTFCAFDGVDGTKIMVNIPRINTIREKDE